MLTTRSTIAILTVIVVSILLSAIGNALTAIDRQTWIGPDNAPAQCKTLVVEYRQGDFVLTILPSDQPIGFDEDFSALASIAGVWDFNVLPDHTVEIWAQDKQTLIGIANSLPRC